MCLSVLSLRKELIVSGPDTNAFLSPHNVHTFFLFLFFFKTFLQSGESLSEQFEVYSLNHYARKCRPYAALQTRKNVRQVCLI